MTADEILELTSESSPIDIREAIEVAEPGKYPNGWFTWENVKRVYIELARVKCGEVQKRQLRWDELQGEGRGIVTAGGGLKYIPSLWVNINELRRVGYKLPVEIWYL